MADGSGGDRAFLLPPGDDMETRSRSSSCGKDHWDVQEGFGEKTITFAGSFCLNLNNCMGPAMVLLPLLNQQAGWLTPTVAMVLIFALSSLSATMLCEAMQRIPGNFNFGHRYEFASTVRHYYGEKPYYVFQLLYNLSLQTSNIAAMIISAQVVDLFLHQVFSKSFALDYINWQVIQTTDNIDEPWCNAALVDGACPDGQELTWIVSLGFVICMAVCIPFGYLNLDDNMWFQWFSLVGLVAFTLEFYGQFIYNFNREDKICLAESSLTADAADICTYDRHNPYGNFSHNGFARTPVFGANLGAQSSVVGITVFAYAYIVTIPSWVNEKKHSVNVNKAVWYPAAAGLIMKLLTGLLGAWAYALVQPNGDPRDKASDILNILTLQNQPVFTQYSAYLWDITTLIPGIPVLAIMVRYNLLNGNVCGRLQSFFWGVVAPWIVTMFCYQQGILQSLCSYVALVVSGYINFVVPCVLYRSALLRYPVLGERSHVRATSIQDGSEDSPLMGGEPRLEQPVQALPDTFLGMRVNKVLAADVLSVFFAVLSTSAIILQIVSIV